MKLLLLALSALAYGATVKAAPVEPSVLDNDLLAFDKLYPKMDVDKVFSKYTYQIHIAYNYMKSPEFAKLLESVEKTMEFGDVLKFLQDSKLDVYDMFNRINKDLGIDIHFPMAEERKVLKGTLVDMINELKKLVPKEKIYAMYKTKVQTSPDYANFVKRLHSNEFKDLSIKFMDNANTRFLIKSAHKNGVPLVKFLEFEAYHWGLMFDDEDIEEEYDENVSVPPMIATRNLQNDLDSFMELIPFKEIEDLFLDYLTNDEEFQEMLEYVTSDAFKALVKEIENMPEVREGLDFLEKAGLPAYDTVNKLNKFLEIASIKPALMKKASGGLRGFLDKVRSMLPIDKLKAMYEKKLATSKDFAALVEKLKSKESQAVVDKLMKHKKFQEFLKVAEEHGVRVQEVFDLLKEVFGLQFPTMPQLRDVKTNTLKQDLEDFVQLLPRDDMIQLVEAYMYEDSEFQEAVSYLFSDDFQTIVNYVESMPEFQSFLEYLEDRDVPVREIVQEFNEMLDIEKDNQQNVETRKIKGGLKGFAKEFKKLMPMKRMKMLYKEKMSTSPDFQEFVMKMKSPETKEFIKKVFAHPKVQELVTKLNDKGIKVDTSIMSM